jgi:hypothetical protein
MNKKRFVVASPNPGGTIFGVNITGQTHYMYPLSKKEAVRIRKELQENFYPKGTNPMKLYELIPVKGDD